MVNDEATNRKERLEKFIQHLEEARQLRCDWMTYGLECAELYIEDLKGDWLEKWGEDEERVASPLLAERILVSDETGADISVFDFITAFLASDYPAAVWARESHHPLAVRVQQQLKTEGLFQILARLEECLSIADDSDRLCGAITVLVGGVTPREIPHDSGDEEDEIQLRDLAESLLAKLATFE